MGRNSKDKAALEVWSKLARAYDKVRKAHMKEMSKFDLTAPQFGVLEVLRTSGPMPLKKISEELMVTGANITCVVDNLEKEELVQRVHSKEDRRIIHAELTPKGAEKMEKIYPSYSKNLSTILAGLTDDDKKEFVRMLDKLVVNGNGNGNGNGQA